MSHHRLRKLKEEWELLVMAAVLVMALALIGRWALRPDETVVPFRPHTKALPQPFNEALALEFMAEEPDLVLAPDHAFTLHAPEGWSPPQVAEITTRDRGPSGPVEATILNAGDWRAQADELATLMGAMSPTAGPPDLPSDNAEQSTGIADAPPPPDDDTETVAATIPTPDDTQIPAPPSARTVITYHGYMRSPNGRMLALVSQQREDGRQSVYLEQGDDIGGLAVQAADGEHLVLRDDRGRSYRLETGQRLELTAQRQPGQSL